MGAVVGVLLRAATFMAAAIPYLVLVVDRIRHISLHLA